MSHSKDTKKDPLSVFENLLTTRDLSQWLNVSEAFVRDQVFYRRIPYVKVGRLVRFDPKRIQEWLTGREREQ